MIYQLLLFPTYNLIRNILLHQIATLSGTQHVNTAMTKCLWKTVAYACGCRLFAIREMACIWQDPSYTPPYYTQVAQPNPYLFRTLNARPSVPGHCLCCEKLSENLIFMLINSRHLALNRLRGQYINEEVVPGRDVRVVL